MAKDPFTDEFQYALRKEIEKLFEKDWQLDGFYIKCEYSKTDMIGTFNQYVDIGIKCEDLEHSFIGIEIEHLSEYPQARKNIRKLRNWAHNSAKRKCGLLHLFNEDCYIDEDEICALRDFAYENEAKNCGFFYDYAFYMRRSRSPQTVAREVVGSKDFRTRLYQLLKYTGICLKS